MSNLFWNSNTNVLRTSSNFLNYRNKGGLTKPSSSINLIVKVTNSCIEVLKKKKGKPIFGEKNILSKVTTQVFGILYSRHPRLLSELDSHIDVESPSHRVAMIKKVIHCYLCVKLKHDCREFNQNSLNKKIRRNLTKNILFQGQWLFNSLLP